MSFQSHFPGPQMLFAEDKSTDWKPEVNWSTFSCKINEQVNNIFWIGAQREETSMREYASVVKLWK